MNIVKFEEANVTYAKDQDEYQPLPAFLAMDGTAIFAFEPTPKEMQQIVKNQIIWFTQSTFNRPLQPVMCSVDKPPMEDPTEELTKEMDVPQITRDENIKLLNEANKITFAMHKQNKTWWSKRDVGVTMRIPVVIVDQLTLRLSSAGLLDVRVENNDYEYRVSIVNRVENLKQNIKYCKAQIKKWYLEMQKAEQLIKLIEG